MHHLIQLIATAVITMPTIHASRLSCEIFGAVVAFAAVPLSWCLLKSNVELIDGDLRCLQRVLDDMIVPANVHEDFER